MSRLPAHPRQRHASTNSTSSGFDLMIDWMLPSLGTAGSIGEPECHMTCMSAGICIAIGCMRACLHSIAIEIELAEKLIPTMKQDFD